MGWDSVTFRAGGKAMSRDSVSADGGEVLVELTGHWGWYDFVAAASGMMEEAPQDPAAPILDTFPRHLQAVQPGVSRAVGVQQHPPRHAPEAQSKLELQVVPGF